MKKNKVICRLFLCFCLFSGCMSASENDTASSNAYRIFSEVYGTENMDIISQYLRTDLGAVEDSHLRYSIEGVVSDSHFDSYILSLERLDGKALTPTDTAVVQWEYAYSVPLRKRSGLQATANPLVLDQDALVERAGCSSPQKKYFLYHLKEPIAIDSATVQFKDRKNLFADSAGIPSFTIEKAQGKELVYKGNKNGIENISISPFHIWMDFRPYLPDNGTIPDIFLEYQDGSKIGRTSKELEKAMEADPQPGQETWWYCDANGVYLCVYTEPLLELSKIKSLWINHTEYPLEQKEGDIESS